MVAAQERAREAEREADQVRKRLVEAQRELAAELDRVAEAKRAGEAAERHATDVRRQVQKEAKRVAELAAAAVLAAAASPDDEEPGETAVLSPAPTGAGGPVGAHAADQRGTDQHGASGKISASAKVAVPTSSRVGADAD